MKFLQVDDLLPYIKLNQLSDILDMSGDYEDDNQLINELSGNTILNKLESAAIDQVITYIGAYYDTDVIFSGSTVSGSTITRNEYIVKLIVSIMLNDLYLLSKQDGIPDRIKTKYEEAKQALDKIGNKDTVITLPLKNQTLSGTTNATVFSVDNPTNINWNGNTLFSVQNPTIMGW